MMDRAIMHYVIQYQKPHLSFTMKDKTHPNGNVGIEFDVKEIKEFSDNQMQLYGFMISADWKGYIKKHVIVKCVFGQEGKNGSPFDFKYYLVENYGSTIKTPSIELLGEPDNEKTLKNIISEISELRERAKEKVQGTQDLSSFNLNGKL